MRAAAGLVPPEPLRHLHELTCSRAVRTAECSRKAQRLDKEREQANLERSVVATDLLGVFARAMRTALLAGERALEARAEVACARMRLKSGALVEALSGNFTDHHAFWCRLHLQRIDRLLPIIAEVWMRIDAAMAPGGGRIGQLSPSPGVGKAVAGVIIAETGAAVPPQPAVLLGWGLSRSPGIGRQTQVRQDPTRRPRADRSPGSCGDGCLPHQGPGLSGGLLSVPRVLSGQEEGPDRPGTLDLDCRVAHAHRQGGVPRSWR